MVWRGNEATGRGHPTGSFSGCRTLVRLYELLVFLTNINEQQRRERRVPNNDDNYWNEVVLPLLIEFNRRVHNTALHKSHSTTVRTM